MTECSSMLTLPLKHGHEQLRTSFISSLSLSNLEDSAMAGAMLGSQHPASCISQHFTHQLCDYNDSNSMSHAQRLNARKLPDTQQKWWSLGCKCADSFFCSLTTRMTDMNLSRCQLCLPNIWCTFMIKHGVLRGASAAPNSTESMQIIRSPAAHMHSEALSNKFPHTYAPISPLQNYHTHARTHTHTHTHTLSLSLSLFWQFCVSAKTTGTVDISLWLRFHSLWSQPCCLASLKGHRCCLSKSQQKHTMQCSVCVCVCVRERDTHTHRKKKRYKVCVFNL